jgi:molybdate transport system regulatory protein
MSTKNKFKTSFKVWLEYKGKPLLGAGGAEILKHIHEYESISKAAEKLDMSYRYVWGYVRKMEKILGDPVIETFKGGRAGGGGARLTKLGASLVQEYEHLQRNLGEVLFDTRCLEVKRLKISARNRLEGKVVSVEKEGLMAKVKVGMSKPATVTAMISKEAADELGLKVGDQVAAIVKATEVMIAK